ncbi:RDD family protein [Cellulomonas sp.]|uniref:RDD family protein n=1 Tax=Cellulomonas sp. TaxID=40001 RepID=UPI001B1C9E7C|nr:RDD family protein [Cellulomonas sp.]MBO9556248.1 RDD family protein [Cellulomonas sp.]
MTLADAPVAPPVRDAVPSVAYAPWWRRALGSLLDGALVAAVAWLATGSPVPVPFLLTPALLNGIDVVEPAGTFSWWTAGAVSVVLLLQAFTGVTPGKSVVGIRVVRESDHEPAGLLRTAGREVLHVLDWILLIGWLRPLWNARRQTFADTLASTVVVRGHVDVPVRLIAAVASAFALALVVSPTVSETGTTTVSCGLADRLGGIETVALRVPGDVWVSRLGIRRLSTMHPQTVLTWTSASAAAPADGTRLGVSLRDRDDHEVWHRTVTFRDGVARTDDVHEVPELTIPHDVTADAGSGWVVRLTSEAGGTSSWLCTLGGPEGPDEQAPLIEG